MSANPNQHESGLQVVQPTPLPAAQRGPRLGLPTSAEMDALREYGEVMVRSGFCPSHIKSAEAAIVVMRYGHQLGIDEFTALQNMYVLNGRASMFANLLHSIMLRDHTGEAIKVVEFTPERCEIACKRKDRPDVARISYTIEEARAAGLADKAIWKQYPADMLFNRCISRASRQVFRDSTMGMYTPEEIGANVIEVDGEVVDFGSDPDLRQTKPANPNRLANIHRIGGERGLDHDALHRISVRKFGMGLGDAKLTQTMLSYLETAIEGASDAELRDWSFDWFWAIQNAETFGATALDEVARQIKDAGISQKTHPDIAAAFQAAKRRLDAQPVEAEYREVNVVQADASTGEIVEPTPAPASEKPKKPVAEFGKPETASAGADRYRQ